VNFSDNGFSLLKEFEGCRLKAYKDVGGVWTIGYGATGPDVYEGLVISQEQADTWLRQDVSYFAKSVNDFVTVKLNQNEFDALVCLSYNIGLGAFKSSTLLKLLNGNTDRSLVASEFLKWCKVDGKVVEGLKRRREREKSLFLTKALHPLLATSILAQKDTWLKREPKQAADLPAEKKLFVPKGSAHEWASITMVPGEPHFKISLKAQPDATWWFWPADFKIINDVAPVVEEPSATLPKLVLDVPYYSQRDNYTNPLSTCYSSACAMLLKYLRPGAISSDDEYLKTVYKYGESEEASAQLAALKHYGLQAEFRQDGSWSDLESLLVQGIPIPIGILHKGPVSNPTGNGHWITVIGRTADNKGLIVNDPFGDLDLVKGTYISTNGKSLTYSKKNLGPRWMVPVSGNGWFIKAKK
jgi:GH24 family phage-related lysozyme (muramidase)